MSPYSAGRLATAPPPSLHSNAFEELVSFTAQRISHVQASSSCVHGRYDLIRQRSMMKQQKGYCCRGILLNHPLTLVHPTGYLLHSARHDGHIFKLASQCLKRILYCL